MLALLATSTLAMRVPVSPKMQFGNPFEGVKNPFADKNDGATTVTLTVGFRVPERGPKSVLGQLDNLAANAITTSGQGIARLCADTSLLLLRRSNEWVSCAGYCEHFGDDDKALNEFDRRAVKEASKFDDRDTGATVDAALAAAGLPGGSVSQPTMAVVCVVATILGDREEEISKQFNGDAASMKAALQELAASGNSGDEVFAFELFWVPGEDDDVLDNEEIVLDWPELMPC